MSNQIMTYVEGPNRWIIPQRSAFVYEGPKPRNHDWCRIFVPSRVVLGKMLSGWVEVEYIEGKTGVAGKLGWFVERKA